MRALERPHYRNPLRAIYAVPLVSTACLISIMGGGYLLTRADDYLTRPSAITRVPERDCATGEALTWSNSAWTCRLLEVLPGTSLSRSGTITSTGTISLNLTTTECLPGTAVVAINSLGIGTCATVSNERKP